MSEPQGSSFPQPPPVPPFATGPGAWPVPVQALEYVPPPANRRPGVVTAIGVISIVVASFSGLYGASAAVQGMMFYGLSMASSQRAGATWAASTTTVAGPGAPPTAGAPVTEVAVVTPFAMNTAERRAASDALDRRHRLRPRRLEQLDAILGTHGRQLGTDAVTDAGVMPDSRSGEAGADYFVTKKGRLELFDDRAVFFPNDGTPTVRISARPQAPAVESSDGGAFPATGPAVAPAAGPVVGLAPAEVQAVVQQAQTLSSAPLNPAQVAALQTVLSDPAQQYVTPGAIPGAVVSSVVQPNGQAMVYFSGGGMVVVSPQGVVVSQVPPGAAFMPNFQISPWLVALYVALVVVSLGLAVLLLVAGILVVRQSPRGRRLHLIYASVKIPVTLASGVAMAWLMHQMMSGFASAAPGGAGPTRMVAIVWGAVPMVVGCIYPVALLIALNTKSVREYYNAVAAERA